MYIFSEATQTKAEQGKLSSIAHLIARLTSLATLSSHATLSSVINLGLLAQATLAATLATTLAATLAATHALGQLRSLPLFTKSTLAATLADTLASTLVSTLASWSDGNVVATSIVVHRETFKSTIPHGIILENNGEQ